MRYFHEPLERAYSLYGALYVCDHPVYDRATIFRIGERGLCVIQQRFEPKIKATRWGEIDAALSDELYLHAGFKRYFDERSGACKDGLYPTVTVRQIMWALKMKPLRKERWETTFDRRDI